MMKYFTYDWWSGEIIIDPCNEYDEYIRSIKATLPTELQTFIDNVSLHDGHIRHIRLNTGSKELVLILDTDKDGQLNVLEINYVDVVEFESTGDPLKGLLGPFGYGDLGYDEFETHNDGTIEHRMLMSNGIEMRILFRAFSFKQEILPIHGD
ncbi:MAG: DUF4085 family protein [Armatimonadota bacterium]